MIHNERKDRKTNRCSHRQGRLFLFGIMTTCDPWGTLIKAQTVGRVNMKNYEHCADISCALALHT